MRTVPCKIYYSIEDDCWYVESPGFYDGIMTYGESLEDARKMAAEAVSGLLTSYLKHGDRYAIPKKPLLDADWYYIPVSAMQTQIAEPISA